METSNNSILELPQTQTPPAKRSSPGAAEQNSSDTLSHALSRCMKIVEKSGGQFHVNSSSNDSWGESYTFTMKMSKPADANSRQAPAKADAKNHKFKIVDFARFEQQMELDLVSQMTN